MFCWCPQSQEASARSLGQAVVRWPPAVLLLIFYDSTSLRSRDFPVHTKRHVNVIVQSCADFD
jgi:hypothetical protein